MKHYIKADRDVFDLERQDRSNNRSEARRLLELEISDKVPKVVNTERRKKACKSLQYFLTTYFPDIFYLKFSNIHKEVIKRIEDTITTGRLYALALPRGSGKTSMCECAVLWAILTGRSKSAVLVSANQTRANALIKDITAFITFNSKLLEDFPEAVYVFNATAVQPRRVRRLIYNGEPVRAYISANQVVFPLLPGSLCGESCIYSVGLSGAIRGLTYTTAAGEKRRPDLVLIDDPQTRDSAKSAEQCADRRRIIYADILGLAGAGKRTACLVTCTVIYPHDLADNLLDRSTSPEFNGHRFSLVEKFPTNLALWDEWNKTRELSLANNGDEKEAVKFYKEHKNELLEGGIHNWQERKEAGDPSAIYSAMRLYYRDKEAFYSEYQNKPIEQDLLNSDYSVTKNQLTAKIAAGFAPMELTSGDDFITGFIDVHKNLLYYTLVAWSREDASGRVIDFGTYPPQPDINFTLTNARYTLESAAQGYNYNDALMIGLQTLVTEIKSRDYITNDTGTLLNVERLLIDANWSQSADIVYSFIREERSPILFPSHGKYYGAKTPSLEFSTKDKAAGGAGWFIPKTTTRQGVRRVVIDTNYFKTETVRRLRAPRGTRGEISLVGNVTTLNNLFNHLMSEYGTAVTARGKTAVEWATRPNTDNHWWDCLVGSVVGAAMLGLGDSDTVKRRANINNFLQRVRQFNRG